MPRRWRARRTPSTACSPSSLPFASWQILRRCLAAAPLLNTAVEADDAHPLLGERVRIAIDRWRGMLRHTVAWGITRGELRPDVDGDTLATIVISALEGAIMLSRLYGDTIYMHRDASRRQSSD